MEISAVCIGEKWLPYRKAGPEHFFSVHSVFNKVINISTDQGLLSVAAEGCGGSSAFLTVPGRKLDFDAEMGEPCIVQAGCMFLADHTINFRHAAIWNGPIIKGYGHKKIKKENITAFKAVLDRKAVPKSAYRYINSESESRFSGFEAIQRLRDDPSRAKSLIGLGQGLTPAGDDMLLGFMAIVNHTCENREYVRMLHNAVSDSLHKTAEISAQTLVNALNCDYHELVQNCVRDLCEGGKEEVYISAASLISMGATSGSDIACGMYLGMIN